MAISRCTVAWDDAVCSFDMAVRSSEEDAERVPLEATTDFSTACSLRSLVRLDCKLGRGGKREEGRGDGVFKTIRRDISALGSGFWVRSSQRRTVPHPATQLRLRLSQLGSGCYELDWRI